jgi:translation initiation factor IF-2
LAKAKRVFQIAKDLGVKSKDILRKCEAEGIPNITNHMSTVSVGLEETVRQWFGETKEGHEATAVETAPEVAVTRQTAVAEPPTKAAKAKKKARPARPPEETPVEPPAEPADVSADGAVEAPASEAPTAPVEADERPTDVEPEVIDTETVQPPVDVPEQSTDEADQVPMAPDVDAGSDEDTRAAAAVADEGPAASVADVESVTPSEDGAETDKDSGEPEGERNVPRRPSDVAPAGPQLEEAKPAKLRGPRVVRIEQPDRIAKPTRRAGPPGGRGDDMGSGVAADAGRGAPRVGRGPGAGGSGDGPPRHSRTKRRGGAGAGDRGRQSGGGGRGSVDRRPAARSRSRPPSPSRTSPLRPASSPPTSSRSSSCRA